jgi:hypothetical protein
VYTPWRKDSISIHTFICMSLIFYTITNYPTCEIAVLIYYTNLCLPLGIGKGNQSLPLID